jgi:uncharacterized membrane protein (UPF0127 family)
MAYLRNIKEYFLNKEYQMIKKIRIFRGLFLLVLILSIAWFFNKVPEKEVLKIGNCEFEVELALSPSQQYQGLSNRDDLKNNEGMLFIFEEVKDRTFVMREMNFPLDIIFIRDFRVINLYHNLAPEGSKPTRSYHSGSPVDAVLEIKGGLSQVCKIAINSEVNW